MLAVIVKRRSWEIGTLADLGPCLSLLINTITAIELWSKKISCLKFVRQSSVKGIWWYLIKIIVNYLENKLREKSFEF
jgi:hypothetical protein